MEIPETVKIKQIAVLFARHIERAVESESADLVDVVLGAIYGAAFSLGHYSAIAHKDLDEYSEMFAKMSEVAVEDYLNSVSNDKRRLHS